MWCRAWVRDADGADRCCTVPDALLISTGVDILTFGQYLQPTSKHLEVTEFVTPEKFEHWRKYGEEVIGFRWAAVYIVRKLQEYTTAFPR